MACICFALLFKCNMSTKRIIPSLLLKGSGLYKTTKFKDPVYLGDAINVAKIFNAKEVDELMLVDITASKESMEPNFPLIKDIASSCFIPLTYGGGITSLDAAKKLFSSGIEKVALNSVLFSRPAIVKELSSYFGSQSIVVSLNVQKDILGRYIVVNNSLKKCFTGQLQSLIGELTEAGAGEILINDVNRDGTMKGYDIGLAKLVSSRSQVPVCIAGGAGSFDDIKRVLNEGGASGAVVGSLFVFSGPRKAVLISYPDAGEISKILNGNA